MEGTECTLINFGINRRVLFDINQQTKSLDIGESAKFVLASGTIDFIKAAQPDDTLIMIPDGTEIPEHIVQCMALLKDVPDAPYDETLARLATLIGDEPIANVNRRPTRGQMMDMLREETLDYVKRTFNVSKDGRLRIDEEVKAPDTLSDLQRRAPRPSDPQPDPRDEKPAKGKAK